MNSLEIEILQPSHELDHSLEVIESRIDCIRSTVDSSYKEMGELLCRVRDQKLYLKNYQSFEEYLSKRWDIRKSRGYQLIFASMTAKELVSTAVEIPTERAARELSTIPEPMRTKVAKKLAKAGKTATTAAIKETYKSIVPKNELHRRKLANEGQSHPSTEPKYSNAASWLAGWWPTVRSDLMTSIDTDGIIRRIQSELEKRGF